MKTVYPAAKRHNDFPHRTDSVGRQDGASVPEPRAEFYGYPFICGFYMGTDENIDGRS